MTTLKPFDLEAAKRGEPVCARDGRPVRIVCWDAETKVTNYRDNLVAYNILALIGVGQAQISGLFSEEGECVSGNKSLTLFMAPKPKRKVMVPEGWIHKGNHEAFRFVKPKDPKSYIHIPAHEVEVEE